MTTGKDKQPPAGAPDDLSARATEGILGPNPFIGLRGKDIAAAVQQVTGQAIKEPTLVLEQEAALVRELISVLAGNSEIAPSPRRQALSGCSVEGKPVLPNVPAGVSCMEPDA